jgi:hypothetical protein
MSGQSWAANMSGAVIGTLPCATSSPLTLVVTSGGTALDQLRLDLGLHFASRQLGLGLAYRKFDLR